MIVMNGVAEQLLALAFIAAVGLAVRWHDKVTMREAQSIYRFYWYTILPAALFYELSSIPLNQMFSLPLLVVYEGVALLVFGWALVMSWASMRKGFSTATIYGLNSAASNHAFLALPVVSVIWGGTAVVPVAMALLGDVVIMIPLAVLLLERYSRQANWRTAWLKAVSAMLINPVTLSIVAVVIVKSFQIPLPRFLLESVSMLWSASLPVAAFAVTVGLFGLQSKAVPSENKVEKNKEPESETTHDAFLKYPTFHMLISVAGKLLLHPCAILILLMQLHVVIPLSDATAAVFMAAMPASLHNLKIARFYGVNVEETEQVASWSHAISLIPLFAGGYWALVYFMGS